MFPIEHVDFHAPGVRLRDPTGRMTDFQTSMSRPQPARMDTLSMSQAPGMVPYLLASGHVVAVYPETGIHSLIAPSAWRSLTLVGGAELCGWIYGAPGLDAGSATGQTSRDMKALAAERVANEARTEQLREELKVAEANLKRDVVEALYAPPAEGPATADPAPTPEEPKTPRGRGGSLRA